MLPKATPAATIPPSIALRQGKVCDTSTISNAAAGAQGTKYLTGQWTISNGGKRNKQHKSKANPSKIKKVKGHKKISISTRTPRRAQIQKAGPDRIQMIIQTASAPAEIKSQGLIL